MEKKYYSISEVSTITKVPQSTLRFWEKEFEQLCPNVSNKGTRKYQYKDIELIKTIHSLLKEQGLTIPGAKSKLKNNYEEEVKKAKAIAKLYELRQEIIKIRAELNVSSAMKNDTIVD